MRYPDNLIVAIVHPGAKTRVENHPFLKIGRRYRRPTPAQTSPSVITIAPNRHDHRSASSSAPKS